MNTSSFGIEKATLIKVPATANLMIDSADRDDRFSSCWDFQIYRKQPLINGFFSRIGATEVVLEWCENNIRTDLSNNWVSTDISGVQHTITIPDGKYTVATALKYIASAFNDISGTTGKGATAGSLAEGGFAGILFTPTPPQVLILPGPLVEALDFKTFSNSFPGNLAPLTTPGYFFVPDCPDLRPYRYLDFVCEEITGVQDVADATTQDYDRNVLVRWYFDEDSPEQIDEYGFPILMGYNRFCRRRIYNPPKQIKWEQNLQVGNLRFNVYDEDGVLLPASDVKTNWLQTLQLSEG
jgi:hypothetical protein